MWRSNRLGAVLGLLVAATGSCQRPWLDLETLEGVIKRTDGPDLRYRVLGHGGDTAIVVHGGPGLHMKYLLAPLARLAETKTLIFYDQRGRGESAEVTDSTEFTLEADLVDLDAVRTHFKLERVKLIGHHWGGAVAALYAVGHPERVERMVLVSPYPVHYSFLTDYTFVRGDSALWAESLKHVATATTPEEAAAFCRDWWPTYFRPLPPDPRTPYQELAPTICDAPAARLLEVARAQRWISLSLPKTPWRESLNRTPVPTLVIEGGADSTVYRAAKRWAQHLPQARLLMLDGPYTFPWIGRLRGFTHALAGFLGGAWPDDAVKPEPFLPPPAVAANPGRP